MKPKIAPPSLVRAIYDGMQWTNARTIRINRDFTKVMVTWRGRRYRIAIEKVPSGGHSRRECDCRCPILMGTLCNGECH